MHERVKKRTLCELFIEDDHVEETQGIHMRDFRQVFKTEGPCLGIERGRRKAGAAEFDDADLIEQDGRKIGPHPGLVLLSQGRGGWPMALALSAQIGGNTLDSRGDLVLRELDGGYKIAWTWKDLLLQSRIKFLEFAGRLGRPEKNLAASEADEIVGGVLETKVMGGTMRAQEFLVSMLQLRIHLQNREAIVGIIVRIHLK